MLTPVLPFSFDIVMSNMLFYYIGDILRSNAVIKKDDNKVLNKTIFFFLIWTISFCIIYYCTREYYEVAARCYPLGVISYLCAYAGCMFTFFFSMMIEKLPIISKVLIWLGKKSNLIFSIHFMDTLWRRLWQFDNSIEATVFRVLIDLTLAVIIVWTKDKIMKKDIKVSQ